MNQQPDASLTALVQGAVVITRRTLPRVSAARNELSQGFNPPACCTAEMAMRTFVTGMPPNTCM